ncbi:hypothetical protein CCACVL1_14353 [Corchorus capsularis]|uniref:Uncharacterized protein n=1 Tax=Corchorus capsularis TaxID=210143 RepID=A0A1R3I7G5_COCAP|nr:hypothetical protein CCACVL1_14353 [Corchorus capsularis]
MAVSIVKSLKIIVDEREGLGAFKDYAKTDGLEHVCPHCSISDFKKKSQYNP